MPASVLLICADPAEEAVMAAVLRTPTYRLAVARDDEEALALASGYDVLIIDTSLDPGLALELCRRARSDPGLRTTPLLVIGQTDDVEERISYLEAGADDVIGRPYDGRELEARVDALVARVQRSGGGVTAPVPAPTGTGQRRTVAVFAPKGGVGATTIATNIAVAAASHRSHNILLMDLDLQFGAVAMHMDLRVRQTVTDLVRDEPALADRDLFRTYAVPHESGVHVLAGTTSPEQSEMVDADHIAQLLAVSSEAYEAVVADAGSTLDERALQILEWADSVVIPFHPEIPSLKAVHSLMDYLGSIGSIVGKTTFVLNNAFARQALRMRDIELALGTTVALELPYDALTYLNAANEGIPVVIGAPRSSAAKRLNELAERVLGSGGEAPAPGEREPHRGGLFSRGR